MQWLDFNQTWQEIILRGWGFNGVHMVQVATMGAQGEGPKGQNVANFKLLLQIQLK